jgi:hypothetical protein
LSQGSAPLCRQQLVLVLELVQVVPVLLARVLARVMLTEVSLVLTRRPISARCRYLS